MSEMFPVGGVEDRKLNHKFEEPLVYEAISTTIEESDFGPLLSLRIPANFTNGEGSSLRKPKFHKFKESGGMSYATELMKPSDVEEEAQLPNRQFSCKFYSKIFTNPQALDEHQNNHRRERVHERIEKELAKGTFGHLGAHHFCPYTTSTTTTQFPFYKGAHLVPHMPYVPSPMSWPRYGIRMHNHIDGSGLAVTSPLGLNEFCKVGPDSWLTSVLFGNPYSLGSINREPNAIDSGTSGHPRVSDASTGAAVSVSEGVTSRGEDATIAIKRVAGYNGFRSFQGNHHARNNQHSSITGITFLNL